MSHSFTAVPAIGLVRQDDFARSPLIHEIFGSVIAKDPPHPLAPLACEAEATVTRDGIRLTFRSDLAGLAEPMTLLHKFFFIDRDEVRERIHLVDPADPAATSELLVHFPPDVDRDYCHASVYDADNRLLAVYAIVFNRNGKVVHYPFTEKFVSPLPLDSADLYETVDDRKRRVVRFRVTLADLTGPVTISLDWEAIGLIHKREFVLTPEQPTAVDDLLLDDNPRLAPGDWVAIAVDADQRVLAQSLVTIRPAAPAPADWER
jgi:hypothetical protein